jgi:hypothetical protein
MHLMKVTSRLFFNAGKSPEYVLQYFRLGIYQFYLQKFTFVVSWVIQYI